MNARRRDAWLRGGAVAAAAVVVAGCGSSNSNSATTVNQSASSGGGSALATIRNAADTSGAAKGFTANSTISANINGQAFTVNGTTAFNSTNKTYSVQEKMSGSALPSQLSGVSIAAIGVGQQMYIKLPSSLAAELPKPWISMSLNDIGKQAGVAGLGGLFQSLEGKGPEQTFGYLKAISGNVQKVGTATIDGVSTTEYSGTADYSKIASVVGAGGAAGAKSLTSKLKSLGITTVPVNVWLDSSGLVRRIYVNLKSSAITETAQTDITSYGTQANITVPPASQVMSLSQLQSMEGGA